MNFTANEQSVIYDAVRYYQQNKTTPGTKLYWDCDSILNTLFPEVKINNIEPGFRVDT